MKDLHERMLSAIDAYFSAENREEEIKAEDMLLDVRNEIRKQPAQEPVAWAIIASNTGRICAVEMDADEVAEHNPKYVVPLYTHPQAQQPLTDERIEECMKQAYATVQGRNLERAFARAIEQAHGITGEKK